MQPIFSPLPCEHQSQIHTGVLAQPPHHYQEIEFYNILPLFLRSLDFLPKNLEFFLPLKRTTQWKS